MKKVWLFFVALMISCSSQEVSITNLDVPPQIQKQDEKFRDVYKPLDGEWQGKFYIYEDTRGQQQQKTSLEVDAWRKPPFKLLNVIDVHQTYKSLSPFFQKVVIRDTYIEKNQPKTVVSRGVNKVQNGQMWCIVKKPNETVVHTGKTEGKKTIIWQRDLRKPMRIEYFKETVEANTYTILGWGYYGKDKAHLGPKIYFYGEYQRVTKKSQTK